MEGLRLEKDVWVSTAPLTSLAGEGEEQDLEAEISVFCKAQRVQTAMSRGLSL